MFKLITVILIILIQMIKPKQTTDAGTCGRIMPKITHYIYGGKSSMIEQWPWQVRKIIFFFSSKYFKIINY